MTNDNTCVAGVGEASDGRDAAGDRVLWGELRCHRPQQGAARHQRLHAAV